MGLLVMLLSVNSKLKKLSILQSRLVKLNGLTNLSIGKSADQSGNNKLGNFHDYVEKEVEEEKKEQAAEAAKNLKAAQNAAAETTEDKAPAEKAGLEASPSEKNAAANAEAAKQAANAKEDLKNGIVAGEKLDDATAKKNQEIEEHLAKAGESEADK